MKTFFLRYAALLRIHGKKKLVIELHNRSNAYVQLILRNFNSRKFTRYYVRLYSLISRVHFTLILLRLLLCHQLPNFFGLL